MSSSNSSDQVNLDVAKSVGIGAESTKTKPVAGTEEVKHFSDEIEADPIVDDLNRLPIEHPDVYNKLIEPLAMQMCTKSKKHLERIKKINRGIA